MRPGVVVVAIAVLAGANELAGQTQSRTQSPRLMAYAVPAALKPGPQAEPGAWAVTVCNNGPASESRKLGIQFNPPLPEATTAKAEPETVSLSAGACENVNIEISGAALKEGWWPATIKADEFPIAETGVSVRPNLVKKLNLRAQSVPPGPAKADVLDLVSVVGSPASVILTNAESEIAPISWRIENTDKTAMGATELPGSGAGQIRIDLDPPQSRRAIQYLWPYSADATLVIRAPGSPGRPLTQYIPVRLRRNYFRPLGERVWVTLLAFLLLSVGGILSFLVQTAFPNMVQRNAIRGRLAAVDAQLTSFDQSIGPQTATALRTFRRQLRDRADQLPWLSLQAASEWQALSASVRDLETRVAAANRLAAVMRAVQSPAGAGLGWIISRKIATICREAARLLQDPDQDPAAAHDRIATAESLIDNAGSVQPDVADDVQARIDRLKANLQALETDKEWNAFKVSVAWFKERVNELDLAATDAAEQLAREQALLTLELLLNAYRCAPAMKSDKTTLILKLLAGEGGWRSLREAESLMWDSHLGLRPGTIRGAVESGAINLLVSRQPAIAFEPVAITAWFEDDRLNYTGFRDLSHCHWEIRRERDGARPVANEATTRATETPPEAADEEAAAQLAAVRQPSTAEGHQQQPEGPRTKRRLARKTPPRMRPARDGLESIKDLFRPRNYFRTLKKETAGWRIYRYFPGPGKYTVSLTEVTVPKGEGEGRCDQAAETVGHDGRRRARAFSQDGTNRDRDESGHRGATDPAVRDACQQGRRTGNARSAGGRPDPDCRRLRHGRRQERHLGGSVVNCVARRGGACRVATRARSARCSRRAAAVRRAGGIGGIGDRGRSRAASRSRDRDRSHESRA